MDNPDPSICLDVVDLAAGYGGEPVISGINITVRRGELLGLLGANGTGKSTLLRAVSGQLPLAAGSVRIAGTDLATAPERAKAKMGYAVDTSDLPHNLTGRQYLELVASIRGCAPDDWPCEDLIGALGAATAQEKPIGACSLGTRMKAAIAGAMLARPELLIFDESLNGLDPVAAFNFKRILRGLAVGGRCGIILSTHVIEVVESVCSTVILLADGRIARRWDSHQLNDIRQTEHGLEAVVMAEMGRETVG